MSVSRKQTSGSKALAFPVVGIVLLLTCYWILADWRNVPMLIDGTLASMHLLSWPS
jgi:hypothetical protein